MKASNIIWNFGESVKEKETFESELPMDNTAQFNNIFFQDTNIRPRLISSVTFEKYRYLNLKLFQKQSEILTGFVNTMNWSTHVTQGVFIWWFTQSSLVLFFSNHALSNFDRIVPSFFYFLFIVPRGQYPVKANDFYWYKYIGLYTKWKTFRHLQDLNSIVAEEGEHINRLKAHSDLRKTQ